MKPKGWKLDPHWVVYEENRQLRRTHRLAQLRETEQRLVRMQQEAEQAVKEFLHAVH